MALALLSAWGCDSPPPSEPVAGEDAARIKAELEGRSFRQFEPSRNGDPRKGAILDFFGPIAIWAQYAEGEWAVNEWEIFADDYRIEGYADGSEVTIYLEQPRSQQLFPPNATTAFQPTTCRSRSGTSLTARAYRSS